MGDPQADTPAKTPTAAKVVKAASWTSWARCCCCLSSFGDRPGLSPRVLQFPHWVASFLGLKFYLLPEASGLPSSLQKRVLQVGGTSYGTLQVKGNYRYKAGCCNSGVDYTKTASSAHRGQQHQYFKTPPRQGAEVCVNVEVGTRIACCLHYQAV